MAFGIDFGTTNTAVVECLTTSFRTTFTTYGENNQPYPSLVALHPDRPPLFGWDVKKMRSQLTAQGYQVIASFKSILGSDTHIQVGTQNYTPLDITALFLSYVKQKVESKIDRKMEEAVMAIPVDFRPQQRRELRKAAERAGIHVKSFVSEPTAAYVRCSDELASASNIAVFDWGGGTLDISLISVENHEVSELSVVGKKLGGNDIDLMLARSIHAKICRQGIGCSFDDLPAADRDRIIERSEEAKKQLSDEDIAHLRLLKYAGRVNVRESITLDEFAKLIDSQVTDAEKLLCAAAKKAGVGLGEIDAILMVGGSCEMQPIYNRMEKIGEEFHVQICRPEGIQWSVAGGAALLSERNVRYRLQNSFGVLLSDGDFYPVFVTGQEVPCKSPELRFGVVEDTNTAVFVFSDIHNNIIKRISVPIKGFTSEGIHLRCEIDDDMIAHIEIFSTYAERMKVSDQINQLAFAYKIG